MGHTWDGRLGLLPSIRRGNTLAEADLRSALDNSTLALRGLGELLASSGRILSGVAFVDGDTYPAQRLLFVADDGLFFRTTAADQAIDFEATSGTLALYAVLTLRTDADATGEPAMAGYDVAGVSLVARAAASAAPAHSLKLGEGSATASAFTTFTETSGLRSAVGSGASLPAGGTTRQALVKASGDDGDVEWDDLAAADVGADPAGTAAAAITALGLGDIVTHDAADFAAADPDLAALAALSTAGLLARTGDGTAAARTLTGTTNRVTVTNGDGVSGNPTLSTPQDIHTAATPTFAGLKAGTPASLVVSTAKVQAMGGNIRAWDTATLGSELHTQSNAASVASEANATTGWTTTSCTLTADATAPYAGSYSLKGVSTGSSGRMQYSFTAVVGAMYRVNLWVKRGTHAATPSARIRNHAGLGTAAYVDADGETWTEYTLVCVATATTASVYVYAGNTAGDEVWVDSFSVKQVLGGELIGKLTGGAGLGLAVDQAGNGILDGNLQVNGNTTLGNTSLDEIDCTGRLKPPVLGADPLVGGGVAGTRGQLAVYNDKLFIKHTGTGTDTNWTDLTAAGGGGTFDPNAIDTLTFTKNVANPPPAIASRTALSSAKRYVATAEYNGWAYVIGGLTTGALTTVEKAAINSDGTLGSWTAVTSLPAARYYQGAWAKDGYLWAMGGNSHPGYVRAPINSDGTLGSWTAVGTVTDYLARANNTSWALGPHGMYQVGGNVYGYPMATVDHFDSSGTTLTFNVATELPIGLWKVAAVVCNGYLFSLGGNSGSAAVPNVYCAPVNATTGVVGSWAQQRSLPVAMEDASALAYNGRIWVFHDDLMYSATVRDDGTLGLWHDEGTGPGLVSAIALAASSGRGYLLGGYDGAAGVTTVNQLWSAATDVEYTVGIGDDGVLWVERGAEQVVGFGGYPGDPNIVVTTGADGTIDLGLLPDGLLVASAEGTPLTKVNIGGGTPSWTPTGNECRMVFDDDYRWLWIYSSYGWQKFTPGY